MQPDKRMKAIHFIGLSGLFFQLFSSQLQAQTELFKFQIEKTSNDGQVSIYEGMTNAQGEVIVPAEYDYIWQFDKDTITLARKRQPFLGGKLLGMQYQLITQGGYLLYEFPYNLIPETLSEGTIRVYDADTETVGLIELAGGRITKSKFQNYNFF